ncbi:MULTISPECIES: antibiotic biosynthesis monooxygenase [unclassified Exiguobacterium]|uniref:putative quinol monooxygenase n=1 Tax=unclassified Exiguobacterium TaxID=2644629 RepID=UPI001BE84171|nr:MULTISPECIES: antibiotic biosynthesis monooxygenase [unclassified Exiguobacterium]
MLVCSTARQGKLVELLLEAAASFEDEPSCLHYIVSVSEEADPVIVHEIWTNQASHKASLELPATRRLIEQARPFITGMERLLTFDPQGGKGL